MEFVTPIDYQSAEESPVVQINRTRDGSVADTVNNLLFIDLLSRL